MKSVIACLVVVSLVSGCTAGAKRAGYGTGAALAVIGGGMAASSALQCTGIDCDDGGFVMGYYGTMALAAGVAIMLLTAVAPSVEDPKRTTLDPKTVALVATLPPLEPSTNDPTLRNFTQQASLAARTGQCLAVRAIAKRVEEHDRSYRYGGFVADPLVDACLQ